MQVFYAAGGSRLEVLDLSDLSGVTVHQLGMTVRSVQPGTGNRLLINGKLLIPLDCTRKDSVVLCFLYWIFYCFLFFFYCTSQGTTARRSSTFLLWNCGQSTSHSHSAPRRRLWPKSTPLLVMSYVDFVVLRVL